MESQVIARKVISRMYTDVHNYTVDFEKLQFGVRVRSFEYKPIIDQLDDVDAVVIPVPYGELLVCTLVGVIGPYFVEANEVMGELHISRIEPVDSQA